MALPTYTPIRQDSEAVYDPWQGYRAFQDEWADYNRRMSEILSNGSPGIGLQFQEQFGEQAATEAFNELYGANAKQGIWGGASKDAYNQFLGDVKNGFVSGDPNAAAKARQMLGDKRYNSILGYKQITRAPDSSSWHLRAQAWERNLPMLLQQQQMQQDAYDKNQLGGAVPGGIIQKDMTSEGRGNINPLAMPESSPWGGLGGLGGFGAIGNRPQAVWGASTSPEPNAWGGPFNFRNPYSFG